MEFLESSAGCFCQFSPARNTSLLETSQSGRKDVYTQFCTRYMKENQKPRCFSSLLHGNASCKSFSWLICLYSSFRFWMNSFWPIKWHISLLTELKAMHLKSNHSQPWCPAHGVPLKSTSMSHASNVLLLCRNTVLCISAGARWLARCIGRICIQYVPNRDLCRITEYFPAGPPKSGLKTRPDQTRQSLGNGSQKQVRGRREPNTDEQ